MRKFASLSVFPLLLLIATGDAWGQSPAPKLEVGVQFTSLTFFPPEFFGIEFGSTNEPGVGGRITYNLTDRIAIESELNILPNRDVFRSFGAGRAVQGQFGIKAGKRFRRFGIFAKARPGFLSVGDVFFFEPGASLSSFGSVIPNARIARRTHFTTDLGVALEFYPAGRALVRFDAGDTIVRYGPSFDPIGFNPNNLKAVPARIKHNFQLSAGIGFRFRESRTKQRGQETEASTHDKTPKYEAGIQFTSISFTPPRPICFDICFIPDHLEAIAEPGFGGRFGYNLNEHFALEAEVNFFARQQIIAENQGHLVQGQFGLKAGKRWKRFGIFAKARPGLLSFSKVDQLVGTRITFFGGTTPFELGIFRVQRKSHFSADVGGVIEFYVSRRLLTRFDVGDTIVRYSKAAGPGSIASHAIQRRPAETHHNFQFSAGVGLRF